MKIIKDQLGREFSVSKNPKRIISLVPSQTELLCGLNLENELVGITKFCVHPYQLKSTKTIVGGTKKVDFVKKINFKLTDFKEFIKTKPTRKVAYFIWAKPWMVAGNDTYINQMLQLNKFENIYKNMSRYPKIEIDKIRYEGDPEVIILSSEPFPFKDEHALEISSFTNRSITVFADGEMFSWHGSRLLLAFDYFKALHKKLDSH